MFEKCLVGCVQFICLVLIASTLQDDCLLMKSCTFFFIIIILFFIYGMALLWKQNLGDSVE